MSRVDDLIANYERFARLPWLENLAPAQRVWMAVYAPEEERRLRLHLPEFGTASQQAGHDWDLIDITTAFEEWMAHHEYRDAYFAVSEADPARAAWFLRPARRPSAGRAEREDGADKRCGTRRRRQPLRARRAREGVGAHRAGREPDPRAVARLLPGEVEGNNYRLLGAQDGWNYHAAVISSEKGWSV